MQILARLSALMPQPGTKDAVLGGILCRLGAVGCLASMGAAVKHVALAGIPPVEVMFFRGLFAFIPVGALAFARFGFRLPPTNFPMAHVRRSLTGVAALFLTIASLSLLPLSQAVSIGFVAPLFVILLSGPLLREQPTLTQWIVAGIGFLGVGVMLDPDFSSFANIGALAGIGAAFFSAGATIAIRKMAHESASVTTFYFTAAITVCSAFLLPFFWVTPWSAGLWASLALVGIFGGLGQLLLTQSLRLAAPSVVTPFDYLQLFWAAIIGFALWREIPTAREILGCAVIVSASAYLLFGEAGRRGLARLLQRTPLSNGS